jgi:N4-gp56 family major capsid protein
VKEAGDVLSDLVVRTREGVRYAALKAGTNVIYNTSSISSRATVNGPISLGRLQVAIRNLRSAKAAPFTQMSSSSTNYGSQGCEPAYFVFAHSDCETDIRSLPGFVAANTIARIDKAAKNSQLFGATQNMLFFTSPELTPFADAGASITGTGLKSTTGTNADVYPWLVMGKHAATSFMLMGDGPGGLGAFEPIILDKAEKSDPTNERIMIGGAWYDACLITAQEWMYRVETGVTANP